MTPRLLPLATFCPFSDAALREHPSTNNILTILWLPATEFSLRTFHTVWPFFKYFYVKSHPRQVRPDAEYESTSKHMFDNEQKLIMIQTTLPIKTR